MVDDVDVDELADRDAGRVEKLVMAELGLRFDDVVLLLVGELLFEEVGFSVDVAIFMILFSFEEIEEKSFKKKLALKVVTKCEQKNRKIYGKVYIFFFKIV